MADCTLGFKVTDGVHERARRADLYRRKQYSAGLKKVVSRLTLLI